MTTFAAGRLAGLYEARAACADRAQHWIDKPNQNIELFTRWSEARSCASLLEALASAPQVPEPPAHPKEEEA